ncbi:MAG: RNA polymerase sigma-70 factor (ECF subfamily) [Verrucomicrobiales bacterium]|jgi:RNA polymerase sigma-70 factor (ECF subfamily)
MAESDKEPDSEFVALLTEHQGALRLYVASLLPGNPAAADVAQQANSTIWRKRADFELGTKFKAWIFAIVRFEVLNFRKQKARDLRLVFSEDLEDIFADELPAMADDFDDRQSALRTCLDELKKSDRNLITHRYFNNTPLQTYADETGRSVAGVRVTLHRLRNRLQKCIEGKLRLGEAKL